MSNIPEDTVWDEANPPTVHKCSGNDGYHITECVGDCEEIAITELDVKLSNEYKAWGRAAMTPVGVPEGVLIGGRPMSGIAVNLFQLEVQVIAIIKALCEETPGLNEKIEEAFKETMLHRMWSIRMANEEHVRETQTARTLGIKLNGKKLLGPDGRPV